jgi:hypothetical protein
MAISFLGHTPDGTHRVVVDHIDNDKSNNNIENLQLITNRLNSSKNRVKYGSSIGVIKSKRHEKWLAYIQFKDRLINLGSYNTKLEAANAYLKALQEIESELDLNVLYPKRIETSTHKGVIFDKSINKWRARFKSKHIGLFYTEQEAIKSLKDYENRL